ncbi:hypothetical protein LDB27_14625 [Salmonella sp. JXY0409-18]|nr:hypothetical protein LDB27_14625 [Salmonella sp. JXY0409-18]
MITILAGLHKSFQALRVDVVLKTEDHFVAGFDSLSESEIIPLSGVSKSGGCCIIHTGGGGGVTF